MLNNVKHDYHDCRNKSPSFPFIGFALRPDCLQVPECPSKVHPGIPPNVFIYVIIWKHDEESADFGVPNF
jgi:hypothetical protein